MTNTIITGAAASLWASIVRTIVPILVGAVLGFAVANGIDVDPEFEATLTSWLSVGFSGVYYIVVRLFEIYVSPKIGWLLGLAKAPVVYDEPAK